MGLLLDIERLELIRVLWRRTVQLDLLDRFSRLPLRKRCRYRGGECWYLGVSAEAVCVFCGRPPES